MSFVEGVGDDVLVGFLVVFASLGALLWKPLYQYFTHRSQHHPPNPADEELNLQANQNGEAAAAYGNGGVSHQSSEANGSAREPAVSPTVEVSFLLPGEFAIRLREHRNCHCLS